MDNTQMINTLSAFFDSIDERNWVKMRRTLSDTLILDSSPVGRPLREMAAEDLVALSRSVGGGFQNTCHHFGNCIYEQNGVHGEIACDLMALHYLPIASGADTFVLFRKMKTRFCRQGDGSWLITHLQTISEQQAGNQELLKIRISRSLNHYWQTIVPGACLSPVKAVTSCYRGNHLSSNISGLIRMISPFQGLIGNLCQPMTRILLSCLMTEYPFLQAE
ncbi:nuclear transport factor 2 family protein [Flavitalea flava]